jgi:hypothetical protein
MDVVSVSDRIKEELKNECEVIDYVYVVWKELG